MRIEHINPFLTSLVTTFRTMLSTEVRRGQLTLSNPSERSYPISGVIGFTGEATGTVVINMSREVAIKAASTMLLEPQPDVNDDVLDAVGELANVIAGQAKAELSEFHLQLSLPSVITGENHEIRFPSKATPVCVPFDTDLGPLQLEIGIAASK